MALEKYREKREFHRTPEPEGGAVPRAESPAFRFVVHKHAARRLHYDLRLELDGVLKSWAVPKGPNPEPGSRSLAVHVEDHPLEYTDFEGVIPRGEYGAGPMMVWDTGVWAPIGDPRRGYERGRLKFELRGEKLRGRWALVRTSGAREARGRTKDEWLLIRSRDHVRAPARLASDDRSVLSGRSMDEIAGAAAGESERTRAGRRGTKAPGRNARAAPRGAAGAAIDPARLDGAVRAPLPAAVEPPRAVLVDVPPAGDEWLHELKYDGYRLIAVKEAGGVRLLTRNRNDWTDRFPAVREAVEEVPVKTAVFDGEVVVLGPGGVPDFQLLQKSLRRRGARDHVYFVFDVPYVNGVDLRKCRLLERKKLLEDVVSTAPSRTVRYSGHVEGSGREFFERACEFGIGGVVSKRAQSVYSAGRTNDWLKTVCTRRQEFVVGGFTDPGGGRQYFGALLLGFYDSDGRLRYAGRVGTGFDAETLAYVYGQLETRKVGECPFHPSLARRLQRGAHWVPPELVSEVTFSGWTEDQRLRHPSFQGLRHDKDPREVVREVPERTEEIAAQDAALPPALSGSRRARLREPAALPARRAAVVRPNVTEREGVRVTHPDRVLYPAADGRPPITKLDLIEYYSSIRDFILPHVLHRPLTIVRCPEGYEGECFYQKHLTELLPEQLVGVDVEEKRARRKYLAVRDLAGLVALVQLGVLEMHPWGSRTDRLDRPDRIVFDLDPGPDVPFHAVLRAAHAVRELLDALGLVSYARTTGGKGLHVVLPIRRRSTWDEVKGFARDVAENFVRREPAQYTATASRSRRRGKIYIDYLRNALGATAVASYSTRARRGALVATPLRWDEVGDALDPHGFHVRSVPERLRAAGDAWAGFFTSTQSLTQSMRSAARKRRPH